MPTRTAYVPFDPSSTPREVPSPRAWQAVAPPPPRAATPSSGRGVGPGGAARALLRLGLPIALSAGCAAQPVAAPVVVQSPAGVQEVSAPARLGPLRGIGAGTRRIDIAERQREQVRDRGETLAAAERFQ